MVTTLHSLHVYEFESGVFDIWRDETWMTGVSLDTLGEIINDCVGQGIDVMLNNYPDWSINK